MKFKQFIVRTLLCVLRGFIVMKHHSGFWLRLISKPFSFGWKLSMRLVGIPGFRLLFFVKRHLTRLIRPTKHRVLQIVTNRYTVHVVMVLIVLSVVFVNIQTRQVRAETFGQKSILYSLVSVDDSQTLEVVEVSDRVVRGGSSSSYLEDTVLDARAHIDFSDITDSYATPVTGGQKESTSAIVKRDAIEVYAVKEGDTLGQIADQYGLNLSTLLWANKLTFRSTIRPGQELKILPGDGVTYIVRSGDTISRIAQKQGVDADKILAENKLASVDTLRIGQELLIPGGEPIQASVRLTAPVSNLFNAPSSKKAATADGTWLWPTQWHVITQYFGWKHTGLDIDGDYTTDNFASRDGVVIYSGWRGGYGLTVEIDHGDGYVTRYAHHSKIYVSVGDVVSAGEAVGRVGSTGRSTGTHIHFEVIKNGKFQNPLDYVR